jgi:hypothetical protein
MRINDINSICNGCNKFEHECNYNENDGSVNCQEHCLSNNIDIIDKFFTYEIISECKDYE